VFGKPGVTTFLSLTVDLISRTGGIIIGEVTLGLTVGEIG
jgi:hypothetical protein